MEQLVLTTAAVERLKRAARDKKRAEGITHSEALNFFAREKGFRSWAQLMAAHNKTQAPSETEETMPLRDDLHLSQYENPSYLRAIFKP